MIGGSKVLLVSLKIILVARVPKTNAVTVSPMADFIFAALCLPPACAGTNVVASAPSKKSMAGVSG
jgi:hypothetical protein